jgi:integrase
LRSVLNLSKAAIPVRSNRLNIGFGSFIDFTLADFLDTLFEGNFETVILVSFKGRKRLERLVPVSERLKEALLELWQSKQDTRGRKDTLDDYIFPDQSYKKAWKQVCQKTGINNLRLRDLRRDFRSRLARLGYSDQLAQRLLGHANDSKMTYYYLEADMEAVLQAKTLLDKQSIKVDAKSDAVN